MVTSFFTGLVHILDNKVFTVKGEQGPFKNLGLVNGLVELDMDILPNPLPLSQLLLFLRGAPNRDW